MARWPSGPFTTRRTGCYLCKRQTSADGGCGVHGYPCTHWGVDTFAMTPEIYAPEDGIVVAVSDGTSPPFKGYGPGVVLIKGVSGFYHLLAHLDIGSIRVQKGAPVTEGLLLGRYNASYGHCHYEVRKQPTGPSETNTVDPEVWLATMNTPLAKLVRGSTPASTLGALIAVGLLVTGYFVVKRYTASTTVAG